MMLLVVGLMIFLGIHLLPTVPEVRNGLRDRLGAGPYRAVYGMISLIGLAIIVLGYHKMQLHPGKNPVLWDPPTWTRHIALLLMLPAMIFFVASLVPSRIRTTLKHPMLIAIKTWALAHLLANGDVASLLLFGTFLAYAVYARIAAKKQGDVGRKDDAPSSVVNDIIVVGVGVALYAALLFGGHEWLIGVAPLPSISA